MSIALYSDKRFWHNAQLLRLISAYCIVYVHLEPSFIAVFGSMPPPLNFMRVATDVFLVLSGFLGAYLIKYSNETASSALWHRLVRILPMYWIFTITAYAFKNFLMSEKNHATVEELLKSLLMIPYGPFPVLSPTWSLTPIVEFGLILSIGRLVSRERTVEIAIIITTILVVIGFFVPISLPALSLYTSTVMADFAFGAFLALLVPFLSRCSTLKQRTLSVCLLVCGAALALFATWSLGEALAQRTAFRMITFGVAALFIVSSVTILELSGVAFKRSWVTRISKYAFTIYLCHLFWNMLVDKNAFMSPKFITIALLIVTPVAVTVIAAIAYHLFEVPITRSLSALKPWSLQRRKLPSKEA